MFEIKTQRRNVVRGVNQARISMSVGKLPIQALSFPPVAIIFVLTSVVFLPSLWAGFIAPRDTLVVENFKARGLGWSVLVELFTSQQFDYYQPLTWLTLSIDRHVWNSDPFGYHLTSVLIHAANAALLYVVTNQLLRSTETHRNVVESRTTEWATALAVLLFSLHPLRVEAAVWVSARNHVLSAFFLLTALFGYLRAAQTEAKGAYWKWFALAIAAQLLSVLSGTNGLALPILMILLDVGWLKRLTHLATVSRRVVFAKAMLEKLPFLALGIAGMIATIGLRTDSAASTDVASLNQLERSAWVLYQPLFCLWKTAVPVQLLPAYDPPEILELRHLAAILVGFSIVTIGVIVLSVRTRKPSWVIAWLGYLTLVFVPRIQNGIDGLYAFGDRFSYVPSLALVVIVAGALRHLQNLCFDGETRAVFYAASKGAICVVLAALAILSWQQTTLWHDTETLLRYAISADRQSRQARQWLADFLIAQDKETDGIEIYREAVRANPNSALAHTNLARALASQHQLDQAAESYRRALEIRPTLAPALLGRGNLLVSQGDLNGAVQLYQKALASAPSASVHVNLGYTLAMLGKVNEAINHYRGALQMDSTNVNAYFHLANAQLSQGQLEHAIENYRKALKLRPSHGRTHFALAGALERQGSMKAAMEHYQEAINLEPQFAEPYVKVGMMLARQDQLDAAIHYFRHALGIRPDFTDARLNLARTLAAQGRKHEALREYEEVRRNLRAGLPTEPVR